jgi:hypothetical protein
MTTADTAITPELTAAIREAGNAALHDIREFVESSSFQGLLEELWSLSPERRPDFVTSVVLDPMERDRRDINVPDGMIIQRSWFEDQRPTLFCITKYLPSSLLWKKVTVTFDNPL